jgi:integrase
MLWHVFDMLRKDDSCMKSLTDDEIRGLVNQWIKKTLDDDDEWKIDHGKPLSEDDKDEYMLILSDYYDDTLEALRTLANRRADWVDPDIEKLLNKNKIKLSANSRDHIKLKREILKVAVPVLMVLRDRLNGEYNHISEQSLYLPLNNPVLNPTQPQPYNSQSEELKKKLSEVMDEYIAFKDSAGHWSIKSESENIRLLKLLIEMTGNPPLERITKDMLTEVNNNLRKLPRNRTKDAKYKNFKLKELLKMDIPKSDRLDLVTINSHVIAFNGLLNWVEKQYGMPAWISGTIISIRKPKSRKTNLSKLPFTNEDLTLIFNDPQYVTGQPQVTKQKPLRFHEFWLPLLGLFTGARTEELCQLHICDFKEIYGVRCINITELDDKGNKVKHTKTRSAERVIPLHTQLIELGLWDLVQRMKAQGYIRLFEGLEPQGTEDKYGAQYSQWFSRKLERIGVINKRGKDKKSFYSFRHTFINYCEQNRLDMGLYERVSGHSIGSGMALTHYAEDIYTKTLFSEVINKINYDIDLSHLKNHKYTISPEL